jgi:hypothetical protein
MLWPDRAALCYHPVVDSLALLPVSREFPTSVILPEFWDSGLLHLAVVPAGSPGTCSV